MLADYFGDPYCSRVCLRIHLNIPEPENDRFRASTLVKRYGG